MITIVETFLYIILGIFTLWAMLFIIHAIWLIAETELMTDFIALSIVGGAAYFVGRFVYTITYQILGG